MDRICIVLLKVRVIMRIRAGPQMGGILPLAQTEQVATTISLLLMPMGRIKGRSHSLRVINSPLHGPNIRGDHPYLFQEKYYLASKCLKLSLRNDKVTDL